MTELLALTTKPLRYARKVTDGGGLYLLITPSDHRYWRYQYRFEGRQKTLALGVYPDVSLQMARGRHRFARRLLADGIDPSTLKRTLGKHAFAVVAREWVIDRRSKSARGSASFRPFG
jgi:hypothetical protein